MRKVYTFAIAALLGSFQYASANSVQHLSLNTETTTKSVLPAGAVKSRLAKSQESLDTDQWVLLGTGSYTDDILTNAGVESATWDVEIYENESTPGFYRVANPFGNGNCPTFPEPFEGCDFLIHVENTEGVWMEYVEMKNIDFGLMGGEYCPAYISDMAGYYINAGYFDPETAVSMGMAGGSMVGGCITFEKEQLLMEFPLFNDGLSLAANVNGLFKVALPGAKDLSFGLEINDICTDKTLTFGYKAGADIEEVKYGIYKGLLSFQSNDASLFESVKSEGLVAADGVVSVEPEYGVNTVAVVALAEGGQIVGKQVFYCYGQQENADEWESIGKAEYSEDVLASIYPEDLNHAVYEVEIQESTTVPGRYRLVDLYGPAYPQYGKLVEENNILTGHNHHHYVVVDATNPERVFIEASPIGADFTFGQVSLFSEGWLSMQLGADLESPEVIEGFGKLVDGKITFLGGAIFVYMPDFGMPRGNIFHKFYIKIPSKSAIDMTVADEDGAKAEYYTVTGVRLPYPTAPGVYIRKCGDKTEKIFLK